jgi:MFS family permease
MGGRTSRYATFLRVPGVPALLVAGAAARLPLGMYGMAILLAVQRSTGSLAVAGLVAGSAAATNAIAGPVQARLIDRYGRPRPLATFTALNLVGFGSLVAGVAFDAGTGILIGSAVIAGATIPAVAASQRTIWRRILPGPVVGTAMAVDSMQLDAYLIIGPLLVGVLASFSPLFALATAAILIAVGTWWFVALPAVREDAALPGQATGGTAPGPATGQAADGRPNHPRDHRRRVGPPAGRGAGRGGRRGPLAAPAVGVIVATIALTGLALGATRVGLTGFTSDRGDPEAVTWLLSAYGVGSLVGGLWAGALRWRPSPLQRYPWLLCLLGTGLLPLLVGAELPVMLLLSAVAGLALTPVTVCEFLLLQRAAPEGTHTEAFAWGTAATFAGAALGSALAGVIAEATGGWRTVLLAAACCPLLAAAYVSIRRGASAALSDHPAAETSGSAPA